MYNNDPNLVILGKEHEIEFSVVLGAKQYPNQPLRSHSEAFYQLRKCLGVQSSNVHSFGCTAQEYRRRKFILGIDLETILEASFSGRDTRAGGLLNIKVDQISNDVTTYPTDMYIVLHSDNILEIHDSGVRVYD